jgi:hypothetical protein
VNEFLRCECGGEKFFLIISFPIDKDAPEILMKQSGVECIKCGRKLSAEEVKKALGR